MIETFREARDAVQAGTAPREAAAALVKLLTPEEKLRCLSGDGPFWAGLGYMGAGGYHQRGFPAGEIERLGIPGFVFCDGPRGVVIGEATAFPVSMARAATWDPALEERVGQAIGAELSAVGATLFGGVCINLLRHPAWGRAQETYGEDPLLVGKMGVALSDGVQRHAMACVKHFAANSMENARFKVDVSMTEEVLHELFLPHFKRVIESGVASVMTAYNQVNGQWCGQHTELLTQILREDWGFDGFVISDWIFGLRDAVESVSAGLDVEMPYRMIRHQALGDDPIGAGLSWQEIDACIVNVVSTCLRFVEVIEAGSPDRSILACSEHRSLAREVAGRSVVLLRNERVGDTPLLPLLPFSTAAGRGAMNIALFGPLADTINLGDGGSSDVWTPDPITICRGLRSRFGSEAVSYAVDTSPAEVAARAAAAEVAVVVVGYTFRDEGEFIGMTDMAAMGSLFPGPDDEGEAEAFQAATQQLGPISPPEYHADREGTGFSEGGDRRSLRLPAAQVELMSQVASANPNTIVVIQAGSAVVISEWDHLVPCIVQAWYGGVEAGNGLADVLSGDLNPSAKLPFSVPMVEEHLPEFDADADTATYGLWHGWWKLEQDGHRAAYPFGFGLSYTRFSIEDPELVQPVQVQSVLAHGADDALGHVRCRVTNTGEVHGAEVVQLYGSRLGEATRPRLVGFARVELGPGESASLEIPIDRAALLEWDAGRGELVLRPGEYRLEVGRNAEDRLDPIPMTCS